MKCSCNGVAVSRDGSTLLVTDTAGGSHAIHEYRVSDGSLLRVIGGAGDGPLQFKHPRQVWVASDDFVFVADHGNRRVQVLTPRLDFHALVGVGELEYPVGVCANDAVVVASEGRIHRVSVFSRCDGALLRRFGSQGSGAGQLNWPLGLCFMSDERHVAVADIYNCRVSVFGVDGDFIRHVGDGAAYTPHGVACSAYDELVVADRANRAVVVLDDSGKEVKTMARGRFSGAAMHCGTRHRRCAELWRRMEFTYTHKFTSKKGMFKKAESRARSWKTTTSSPVVAQRATPLGDEATATVQSFTKMFGVSTVPLLLVPPAIFRVVAVFSMFLFAEWS